MIAGIEPLYKQIADSIVGAIPEAWVTAKFEVIFYSASSTYVGEYTRKADGVARDFPTTRNGQQAFRELRNRFKEAGHPLWGRATFELNSDGTFNMRWGYDNCDKNGDTVFNKKKYLAFHEARHKRLTAMSKAEQDRMG